jgi:hypothetical protein
MRSDLYTKSVLTIIAASLVWLCIQNAVQPRTVSAQEPAKVILAGIELPPEANTFTPRSRTTLPVTIEGVDSTSPMPVKVVTQSQIDAAAKAAADRQGPKKNSK